MIRRHYEINCSEIMLYSIEKIQPRKWLESEAASLTLDSNTDVFKLMTSKKNKKIKKNKINDLKYEGSLKLKIKIIVLSGY